MMRCLLNFVFAVLLLGVQVVCIAQCASASAVVQQSAHSCCGESQQQAPAKTPMHASAENCVGCLNGIPSERISPSLAFNSVELGTILPVVLEMASTLATGAGQLAVTAPPESPRPLAMRALATRIAAQAPPTSL